MSQETRRNNRIPPSTPEVIDLDSFQSYGKRIISDVINLSDDDDEEEDVKILHFIPKTNPSRKRKRNINFEKGESSNSKDTPFVCEICTDTKTTREAFNISGCSHAYCSDCVATYVGSKLDDNIVKIGCPFPGCSGLLEVEFCRSILSAEVFERWGKALCEAMFNFSEKFYCPFKDCSALLINDGTEDVRNSECPNCNRMFCAQCKVPWHDGIECSEFEKLNADERGKEDVMLMNLAKDMQWRRCPKCRIYVARTMGCNFMMCRCRCTFCYQCGGEYSTAGGGCTCQLIQVTEADDFPPVISQEEFLPSGEVFLPSSNFPPEFSQEELLPLEFFLLYFPAQWQDHIPSLASPLEFPLLLIVVEIFLIGTLLIRINHRHK